MGVMADATIQIAYDVIPLRSIIGKRFDGMSLCYDVW